MTTRQPGETVDDFKARRCLRLAVAFRDQAAAIKSQWPDVATRLHETARTAERAAALIAFRAANPPAQPN